MSEFLGLPALASEHGHRLDHVNDLVHWIMLALFVIWGAFFIYLLVRFRRGRNPSADYEGTKSKASTYGEVAVAVVEVVLLVGFSIPLYSERVDDLPDESEATVARVIAQQFAWNIHYPGPDGIFGRTAPELVDSASNPVGLDRQDPNAKDDVTTINQLHLPVNKPALIYLSSMDVIHSFSLPEMRGVVRADRDLRRDAGEEGRREVQVRDCLRSAVRQQSRHHARLLECSHSGRL